MGYRVDLFRKIYYDRKDQKNAVFTSIVNQHSRHLNLDCSIFKLLLQYSLNVLHLILFDLCLYLGPPYNLYSI